MAIQGNVVILSKTLMAEGVCVGAWDVANERMLRLLDEKAQRLSNGAPYEIGQCYMIKYAPHYRIIPPHTEDAAVYEYNYLDTLDEDDFDNLISSLCDEAIDLEDLFDGKIVWDGSGHMEPDDTTNYSVQIATLNCSLTKNGNYFENSRFGTASKRIRYVGARPLAELPNRLSAGTRIRFSLARFWDKDKDGKLRAYLQLSGIYE
ncbi:hypothetical protein [Pseudomonas oryzihabitans]|uniref:hypothetical protein n=1 Tax=Pseudomonas oryzihabitans TaxID=47885 RepID=UPI002B1DE566|nr:hypothetical protein [Pseudomonas oryzihabitans]